MLSTPVHRTLSSFQNFWIHKTLNSFAFWIFLEYSRFVRMRVCVCVLVSFLVSEDVLRLYQIIKSKIQSKKYRDGIYLDLSVFPFISVLLFRLQRTIENLVKYWTEKNLSNLKSPNIIRIPSVFPFFWSKYFPIEAIMEVIFTWIARVFTYRRSKIRRTHIPHPKKDNFMYTFPDANIKNTHKRTKISSHTCIQHERYQARERGGEHVCKPKVLSSLCFKIDEKLFFSFAAPRVLRPCAYSSRFVPLAFGIFIYIYIRKVPHLLQIMCERNSNIAQRLASASASASCCSHSYAKYNIKMRSKHSNVYLFNAWIKGGRKKIVCSKHIFIFKLSTRGLWRSWHTTQRTVKRTMVGKGTEWNGTENVKRIM